MADKVVVNKVLAFIQQAIGTMDEVTVVHICTSSFTVEEIGEAKVLLLESTGKFDRMMWESKSSKSDVSSEKSLQDIIAMFKEAADVPTFVALDLIRVPPVSIDRVDVTDLVKEVTTLKTSLAEVVLKLEASQQTIGELRAEVASLRNTCMASRSPLGAYVNTRRGAQNASSASFESAKLGLSPAPAPAPRSACPCAARPAPPPAEESPRVVTSTPQRDYSAAVTRQRPTPRNNLRIERESEHIRTEPPRSALPAVSMKAQPDKDGFTKVERKKKKPPCRNQGGSAPTGPSHLLRPAVPATYIYVSRLHYTTKAADVVAYLETKTNCRLHVEQLESRNKVNFNSFVVRVATAEQERFLKEELWPAGVVFRKFRGRRRPPGAADPAPRTVSRCNNVTRA